MKIRIVKTEYYNSYKREVLSYYTLHFYKSFLFFKYWSKPSSLYDYGYLRDNLFYTQEDAEFQANEIIKKDTFKTKKEIVKELGT